MIEDLFTIESSLDPVSFSTLLLSLLLAFVCGKILAWIYMLTHSGLSYSRTYVNSLVVMPFLVSLVMTVLANSLITAVGLMTLFAIVRFRNVLRDTLDTCYLLTAITLGMGCGTQRFGTVVVGLALVSTILIYLWYSSFGTRHRYDVILNLHWARPLAELQELQRLLGRHSRKTYLASQRSNGTGGGADISFRLLLRDPARSEELFEEVRNLEGAERVTGLLAQEQSEI